MQQIDRWTPIVTKIDGMNKLPLQPITAAIAAGIIVFAGLAPASAASPWVPLPISKSDAVDDALFPGDAERGKTLYGKCSACHQIGAPDGHRVGPDLAGIVNRPAAAHRDFGYSPALRKAAREGLVWTHDFLDSYLRSPRKFMPQGSMAFVGIKDEQERDDLIAYLALRKPPQNAPWLLSAKIEKAKIPLPQQNPSER